MSKRAPVERPGQVQHQVLGPPGLQRVQHVQDRQAPPLLCAAAEVTAAHGTTMLSPARMTMFWSIRSPLRRRS